MQITLLLHNIRSVYNVGAILRTAEGLGIAKIALSGYTPRYDDPALLPHLRTNLNRQIAKSALGAETMVPIELVDNPVAWLAAQRNQPDQPQVSQPRPSHPPIDPSQLTPSQPAVIVGLENNLAPAELPRRLILGQPWPTTSPSRLVLILGEEVHGIPAELRSTVDYFLEIPMRGRKESFNVSVATGIALWGLLQNS